MQRIDDWIGKPLTWLLGRFTRQARFLGGEAPGRLPRRVICSKFIGIGSVVLSLPLLRALKDAGIEVAFWSFPGQADLVRLSGLADHVWEIRPTLTGFLPSLLRTWLAARRFGADAFLDLEPTANFTALLSRTSGAGVRVGFMANKPEREILFTHLVALTTPRHMSENILWMAKLLGCDVEPGKAALPPLPKSAAEAAPPASLKSSGRRRVVVNINTSDLGASLRLWPRPHWIALCEELLRDPAVELVFPGIARERPSVAALIAGIPGGAGRVFNVAGQTSILELIGLLREADLVVSVDSGVMHLAAWAGAPVVGLFGPETPALYAPRTARARVLWSGLPCSPCCTVATEKHTRCRDNQCMKRIGPAQAVAACRAVLAGEAGVRAA
jgi:ADP-heptose:LPS heptosyltransferase